MDGNIETYVIDASYVLSYLLPDESSQAVEKYFRLHRELKAIFIAPYLLPFEVVNSLKSAVRQKRINSTSAATLVPAFENLKIYLEPIYYQEAFSLSIESDISFYDAAYVQLAREKQFPLLTLDGRLAKLA